MASSFCIYKQFPPAEVLRNESLFLIVTNALSTSNSQLASPQQPFQILSSLSKFIIKMYPTFNANQTPIQQFNPFQRYEDQLQQMENMAAGDQLPPLEDISNGNPFMGVQDLDNHEHTLHSTSQFNQSIKESSKSKPGLNSPASLELLSGYRSKFKRLEQGSMSMNERTPDCGPKKLSTVELIELAAEKFIKFSTERADGYTMFTHPYGSAAFTRLSLDETREVELVFQLLTAAEKVGRRQFDVASKFLARCGWVAADDGTPVERLVYYLCEALQKRIGEETGIPVPLKLQKQDVKEDNCLAIGTNPSFLACHQAIPFNQVLQFISIQAIMDQMATSTKIHLIDIQIRSGVQWTALMQALVERSPQIELIKLTALATTSIAQQVVETGRRLESFASTLNLPFLFKMLLLSDVTQVEERELQVEEGEAVAVFCETILRTMISRPQSLENLMRTMRMIKPLIIVVAEVEANHNSSSFVNRFTETVFFYGAFFDCLDECMSRDNRHRMTVESVHLAEGMQSMVAADNRERICRNINLNTWRCFFSRFGMVEIELSESCMYQGNLVLQRFACAASCTLQKNGKSLIVGWKGTPLHSLSTWNFI